ncbi:radical SAM protein, partial [Candidatus Magnetomorum sp. HK-1]
MDFLLIYPPSYTREPEFPIGGLYLAHSLIKNNFSLEIVNDVIYDNIISFARNNIVNSTIAIGISVVSVMAIKDALNLTKDLKKLYPNIPIIWGGQHIMAQPGETLKYKYVDYVVIGEGENTLPLLLKALKNNSTVKHINGIGYKSNGRCVFTDKQKYTALKGIFDLPYDLFDTNKYYRKLNLGGEKWLSAMYSRGCPFKCSFCINSTIGGINSKIRYHDIEHIIHDIKKLVNKYNADSITILDDHFFLIEDRVIEFCKQILKNSISINFRATGRVDSLSLLDDSTFKLLHDTGFLCIGAGIESGSQRILKKEFCHTS